MGFSDLFHIPKQILGWTRIPKDEELGLVPRGSSFAVSVSTPQSAFKTGSISLMPRTDENGFYFVNPLNELKALQDDFNKILDYKRRCEIVFACIEVTKRATTEAVLVVERRKTTTVQIPAEISKFTNREFETVEKTVWEKDPRHPLARMLRRPNPAMTWVQFVQAWTESLDSLNMFAAEKEISRDGTIARLWPMDVRRMRPKNRVNNQVTEWYYTRKTQTGYQDVVISAKKIFLHIIGSAEDWYAPGVSPLQVAIGVADTEVNKTNYIRAFFKNSGVASGVLKILNKTLTNPQADAIKRRLMYHLGLGSGQAHTPLVIDQNAEWQRMGSTLKELEAPSLQAQLESKLCACFGVPPGLVYAMLSGGKAAVYTPKNQDVSDLWAVKMMPLYALFASVLTWNLLAEHYESEDTVRDEEVRVNFDFSNVKALQEAQKDLWERIGKAVERGLITKMVGQSLVGVTPDPLADAYVMNVRTTMMYPEVAAEDASTYGAIPANQNINTDPNNADPNNPDPNADPAAKKTAAEIAALDKMLEGR